MSKIVLAGACGALVWLLRRYFGGGVCRTRVNLKGKTAIITGGNTGIGKATALALARRGAKVILACRSIARGDRAAKEIRQEVRDAEIGVRFLDLSSLGSVRRFVDDFLRSKNRLHILVNNAGMYGCPHWKSEDGYEMHFAVNHLGHFLLTNLLLDTLSRCGPSRVVVVSSSLHKYAKINFDDLHGDECYVPGAAYGQSKLANILFARELSKRLPPGVTVNSVHPGIVWTELARYRTVNPFLKFLAYPLLLLILKTPLQGAQTTVYCATEEQLEGISGRYFGDCKEEDCAAQAKDDAVAMRLWEVSEELTGFKS